MSGITALSPGVPAVGIPSMVSAQPAPVAATPASPAATAGWVGLAPIRVAPSGSATTSRAAGVAVYGLSSVSLPPSTAYSLPAETGLGVNTIDDRVDSRLTGPDSSIQVTVYVPMATPALAGTVADLNDAPYGAPIPARCVIGDGSDARVFIGIDQRPGTPLERALRLIVAQVPTAADGSHDPEQVIAWVTTNVERFLRKTPGAATNDPGPELPWDRAIKVAPGVDAVWHSVANAKIGAPPTSTGERFPVVPFERYLELGYGYCIQKSMLATLILSRCGVGCRLVTGALDQGPGKSSGHTWVELADGRWLDPTWQVVARPTTVGVTVPGYQSFDSSYRFVNQTYPFLVA